MAKNEIYQRQVNPFQEVQLPQQSDAAIKTVNMIANDAQQMAVGLKTMSEKLYLTEFERTARETIDNIARQNPANPDGLKRDFEAAYKGLTKDASPFMAMHLQEKFDVLTKPYISSATERLTKINTDRLREQSLTVINQATNDLEHKGALMLSSNAEVAFDASRAAQLQIMTMEEMLAQTDENGMPLFSAEQRVKTREDARKNMMFMGIKHWFDEQGDKASAMQQILSGEKKFRLFGADGQMSLELDPTAELDVHSFDKLTTHMKSEVEGQAKELSKEAGIQALKNTLAGDGVKDPTNPQYKKQVNDLYNDPVKGIAAQIKDADDITKANVIVNFVAETRVIPEAVKTILEGTAGLESVQQKAFAADIVMRLQEKDIDLLESNMNTDDLRYAMNVGDFLRGGLSAEDAVRRTNDILNPLKKDVFEQREREFKKLKANPENLIKKAFNSGWMFGLFDPKLPNVPVLADSAKRDFYRIYEEEYVAAGREDQALKMASSRFRSLYTVTNLAGEKTITKYAAEKYYSIPNVDNSWMKEQMLADVRAMEKYKDVKDEDVFLTADPITARDAYPGSKPSYVINVRHKNGDVREILDEDNQPLRYRFRPEQKIKEILDKIEEDKKKTVTQVRSARKYNDIIEAALKNQTRLENEFF